MLRSFGATKWQIFRWAVVPDALPHIAAGIRVCASLSLVLVIVTEMFLGASSGLGRVIYDAYLAYRIPEMYVVIILLGLLGFALNKLCVLLERGTTFWQPETTSL
jgi:ABC-type nitrate/sulfonate/bicarbonate transport system permease component